MKEEPPKGRAVNHVCICNGDGAYSKGLEFKEI